MFYLLVKVSFAYLLQLSLKLPSLFFSRKLGKMSQNLSSAAVVIGVLRVNVQMYHIYLSY